MPEPNDVKFLTEVVNAHFLEELGAENWQHSQTIITKLIEDFVAEKKGEQVATDQLLNTIYLFSRQIKPDSTTRESLEKLLLKRLDSAADQ
jgi:hypothetical protein